MSGLNAVGVIPMRFTVESLIGLIEIMGIRCPPPHPRRAVVNCIQAAMEQATDVYLIIPCLLHSMPGPLAIGRVFLCLSIKESNADPRL